VAKFNLEYLKDKPEASLAKIKSEAQSKLNSFSKDVTKSLNIPNVQDIAKFKNLNSAFPFGENTPLEMVDNFNSFLQESLYSILEALPEEIYNELKSAIANILSDLGSMVAEMSGAFAEAIPLVGQAIAAAIRIISDAISKISESNYKRSYNAKEFQFYEMGIEVKRKGPRYYAYSGVMQNHNYADYRGAKGEGKNVRWRWKPFTPPIRTSTVSPFTKDHVPSPRGSCGKGVCIRMPTFWDSMDEGGKVCLSKDRDNRCKSYIAFTPLFFPWCIPNAGVEAKDLFFTADEDAKLRGSLIMQEMQTALLTDPEANLRADSSQIKGMLKNFLKWWNEKAGNPNARSQSGGIPFVYLHEKLYNGMISDERSIAIYPKPDLEALYQIPALDRPDYFYDEDGLIVVSPNLSGAEKSAAQDKIRKIGIPLDIGYDKPLLVTAAMYNSVVGAIASFFAVQNSILKNNLFCNLIVRNAINFGAGETSQEHEAQVDGILGETLKLVLETKIQEYKRVSAQGSSKKARKALTAVLQLRGYDPSIIKQIIASAELFELGEAKQSRIRGETKSVAAEGRTKAKLLNTDRVKKIESYHRKLLGVQLALYAKQITMQALPAPHGKNLGDPLAQMIQKTLPAWLYVYQNRNSRPGSNKSFNDYPSKIQYEVSEYLKANWNAKDIGLPKDPVIESLLGQLKPVFFQPIIEKSKVLANEFNKKHRITGRLPGEEERDRGIKGIMIETLGEDLASYIDQQDFLNEIDPDRLEGIKNQEKESIEKSKKKSSKGDSGGLILAAAAVGIFMAMKKR